MAELQATGEEVFAELKNLVVWNKTSPGQGSFYRSQHELIFVYKVGGAAHRDTFGLGAHGRTRSNLWTYAGLNSFRAGREDELAMHPTVKPVALVADALRDCSLKGEAVLDVFLGSGTTLLAAEKVARIGYGLEYDPAYVDVSILRWQAYTRAEAVLAGDGRTYAEIRAERLTRVGRPTGAAATDEISAVAPNSADEDAAPHRDAAVVPVHRRTPRGVR
jgi:DNA modification methylase